MVAGADGFERFAERCSSPLARFDARGRLVYANAAFAAAFLGGDEQAPGRDLADLGLPSSLSSALRARLDEAARTGRETSFTWDPCPDWYQDAGQQPYRCRCLPPENGRRQIVELREVPDSERLKKALVAERQVRREAERLKERGRELFFKVIEEIPIFVYMQRRDYTVAYANRKTRDLYGPTEGRLCYEVFGGRAAPCPNCPTFTVFETGVAENWQFTDRQGRTFHIYDYPFEDENGEPLVMELGIDVTDLKRAERELYEARKMRAIGVLAGGIAHDLNNNLAPIILNLDHALGRIGDEALRPPLDESLCAAYRAAELVEQVLQYSRGQSVSRSNVRLGPLVRAHLERFGTGLPGNVRLEADIEDMGEREDWVMANPAQIEQLVYNLCRNAAQAMPHGGRIQVRLSRETIRPGARLRQAVPGPGDYLVLRVSDEGPGIDPERVERIFEPFYTTKKASGGTGMGLAVVHSIVSGHGGTITVQRAPGAGALFEAYLPATQPPQAPPRFALAPVAVRQRPPAARRVLLVDDDQGALRAMERVLLDGGFEVVAAGGGQQGLEAFREAFLEASGGFSSGFDLVVADHFMPDVSGVEMARRVLEIDPAARIVLCTGNVEPGLEGAATRAGVAGFLMKPMTPRALVESVRRYCRRSEEIEGADG